MGINMIRVSRVDEAGVTTERDFFRPYGRGGKNNPTSDELRAATMKLMKDRNDEQLKPWIERGNDLECIFTPPYMPCFQPIELM